MDILFNKYPEYNIIIHGHKQLENYPTIPYLFDGTTECWQIKLRPTFNVEGHGYYKMYKSLNDLKLNDLK